MHFPIAIHNRDCEQQSTLNPNMPLRGLMYFGNLYDSYIESNGLNIYGKKLIKIPTPQYYVLYNGTDQEEAVKEFCKFLQSDNGNRKEDRRTKITVEILQTIRYNGHIPYDWRISGQTTWSTGKSESRPPGHRQRFSGGILFT